MTRRQRAVVLGLLLACHLALGVGCANVRPWERGTLARALMRGPDDALRARFQAHVERVREAMVGASADAGPSCGCN